MFDAAFRARLDAPLARSAERLSAAGVSPNTMTSLGLVVGIACCVAVATGQWWIGLALWIANRLADGLDGPLARSAGPTDWGGFFDIMADFTVYSGVIVAIGIALPETRVAALAVLMTYYLSGGSFLAFSSLATKRRHEGGDDRCDDHHPCAAGSGRGPAVGMGGHRRFHVPATAQHDPQAAQRVATR